MAFYGPRLDLIGPAHFAEMLAHSGECPLSDPAVDLACIAPLIVDLLAGVVFRRHWAPRKSR